MRIVTYQDLMAIGMLLNQNPQAAADALMDLAEQTKILRIPSTLSVSFGALAPFDAGAIAAAGGVQQFPIPIPADAPFMIVSGTYHADIAGAAITAATRPYPNITVMLTDTGGQQQLADKQVPVTSLYGDGQFPFVWPEPKIMPANGTLLVQVTSQEAANATNLRLVHHGYKMKSLVG